MKVQMAKHMELWPVDRLVPYARTHSPEQVKEIAASMIEFGFTNPILVDSKDGIIAGHGRLMAAKEVGLAEVPVIVLDHLSDAQRRAYILADNQLATKAGWDEAMLALELADLQREGYDLGLTGFSEEDLAELLDGDGEGGEGDGEGQGLDEAYTKKIKPPIYSPKGEKPAIAELMDASKTAELLDQIEKAEGIPDEVREFLKHAAQRHTVFDYQQIAEFYCHAPKEVQELFEASALVIIDFDKAVESGFVKMTKTLAALYDVQ